MSDILLQEPAFACASENGHQQGMTLRDYMAGQAMVGFCTGCNIWDEHWIRVCAKKAYLVADAMIAARGDK